MMSLFCYLPSSAWLLISHQQSRLSATPSFPLCRPQQSTSQLSLLANFHLFVVKSYCWLRTNKSWLTFLNKSPQCNSDKMWRLAFLSFSVPNQRKKIISSKLFCFLFFFFFCSVDWGISSHFVKASHYTRTPSESHLQSEFKARSNWLIGNYDSICNYIDTYINLIWLLTLWINTAKWEQLSLWLHYRLSFTTKLGGFYHSSAWEECLWDNIWLKWSNPGIRKRHVDLVYVQQHCLSWGKGFKHPDIFIERDVWTWFLVRL